MMRARLISLATALAVVVAPARTSNAQAKPAGRCTPMDTTAAWFVKQRAWADDSKHTWSNDSLRSALVHAAGLDANPTAGAGTLLGYEITGAPNAAVAGDDAAALDLLRKLSQNRQATWPTKSVVGAQGVRAVWMLAARDSMIARVALHRMMEAGPEESPPAAVAMLEDRLRIAAGRKQLYATQLVRSASGTLEPAPLEDPKHVDLRRDAAGLPPLAQSLCAAAR
jgi:hypothetical protein